MTKSLGILFAFTILLSACNKNKFIRPGDTAEVAYNKAMKLFEDEDYVDAADAFDTVTRVARGSEYAENAQYYLAESYYRSEQFLLAASEFDRFVSYYPQSTQRQEVEYKAALCFFNISPRYRLDQTETRQAIERFQLYINRYPNSEYVPDAADKIDRLREKLARKDFEAGEFYYRTNRYEAATIYYTLTIDQYPETVWAERALIRQINAFIDYADNSVEERQVERYSKAIETYEKFIQLFPTSEYRAEAELLRDQAEKRLLELGGNSGIVQSDQG
ncbi:outer membrane protein assembly factor BamD [Balneola sp. MJW-20]|uniref:outer membrane protein assembly factor BamD n=1 Tax=Gracilimonas aurantiaca TaxID=3234185 RepID=UPI00390A1D43